MSEFRATVSGVIFRLYQMKPVGQGVQLYMGNVMIPLSVMQHNSLVTSYSV